MDIKVGEYIRTKYGEFALIKEVYPQIKAIKGKNKNSTLLDFNLIKNHSFNIIDLIEIGDYVNGEKVDKINEPSLANEYKRLIYCNECEGLHKLVLSNNEIKTIVTKEQFKAMEYEV